MTTHPSWGERTAESRVGPLVERLGQVFPRLTEGQIARVAERRTAHAGEILFEQGETNAGIHVVLSGSLEIVRPALDNHQRRCSDHDAPGRADHDAPERLTTMGRIRQ